MRESAITALLLLAMSTAVLAQPIIIHDAGRTVSADKYLNELRSEPTPKAKPSITKLATPSTPEMSLGRVSKRNVSLPYLPSPMFLIGADNTSLKWLSRHKPALIKAGAVGLIVNAKSPQELQKAMRVAKGLQVSPASGSDLAKQFKLQHYPVLITKTQIAQ